jgi:hypothetical protein
MLIPIPPHQWMIKILSGGKNQLREKTISHKKIQSPLSDWIS